MSAAETVARRITSGSTWGGRTSRAAWWTTRGSPLSSVSIETEAERGPEVGLDDLAEAGATRRRGERADWDEIAAVGLGSPGTMDIRGGHAARSARTCPAGSTCRSASCSADRSGQADRAPERRQRRGLRRVLGRRGAGHAESLVLFTLGTGIGCGIIDHGRIIEGRHSHGAECGHIIIQMENARQCSCGALRAPRGLCLGHALVKRADEALEHEPTSPAARGPGREPADRAARSPRRPTAGDPLAVA